MLQGCFRDASGLVASARGRKCLGALEEPPSAVTGHCPVLWLELRGLRAQGHCWEAQSQRTFHSFSTHGGQALRQPFRPLLQHLQEGV